MAVMPVLDGHALFRLRQAPRPADGLEAGSHDDAQVFAALTATHAELRSATPDPELLFAWYRPQHGGPLHIMLGGRPWCPAVGAEHGEDGAGQVPVSYPPGAVGDRVDTDVVDTAWGRLPAWVCCTGTIDPLWTAGSDDGGTVPRRGGFDDYVAHLRAPFVWLVLAQPVDAKAVQDELEDLEIAIPGLRLQESSERGRVDLAPECGTCGSWSARRHRQGRGGRQRCSAAPATWTACPTC
jgi:hypothetical protein